MGYCFFDTSALVKRYYPETGTEVVDELIDVADSRGLAVLNPNDEGCP